MLVFVQHLLCVQSCPHASLETTETAQIHPCFLKFHTSEQMDRKEPCVQQKPQYLQSQVVGQLGGQLVLLFQGSEGTVGGVENKRHVIMPSKVLVQL